MVAAPDVWSETALVDLAMLSGSDISFVVPTETISIEIGDKPITQIATLKGGRLVKWEPQEVSTISVEGYFIGIKDTAADDLGISKNYLAPESSLGTQPYSITNTRKRKKHRMTINWTDDPTPTSAVSATAEGYTAERLIFADGFITSYDEDFGDKIKKATWEITVPPFDKDGNGNIKHESTFEAGTDEGLPAIASYTASAKFDEA